jgi:hypothetical protein
MHVELRALTQRGGFDFMRFMYPEGLDTEAGGDLVGYMSIYSRVMELCSDFEFILIVMPGKD